MARLEQRRCCCGHGVCLLLLELVQVTCHVLELLHHLLEVRPVDKTCSRRQQQRLRSHPAVKKCGMEAVLYFAQHGKNCKWLPTTPQACSTSLAAVCSRGCTAVTCLLPTGAACTLLLANLNTGLRHPHTTATSSTMHSLKANTVFCMCCDALLQDKTGSVP